ncbi:hypothetical protein F5X68DRAFT_49258 [Plectosphaerella plurivora]|uniref:Uncharacterized protein n=1 Tax=Plectosphaerella plurivora TaxID=936078 RepID=A0A9P8VK19_9PEZI|nr:hypothetical protein F5X68DRAFT_49258 [Plectosphaerella plurivora]
MARALLRRNGYSFSESGFDGYKLMVENAVSCGHVTRASEKPVRHNWARVMFAERLRPGQQPQKTRQKYRKHHDTQVLGAFMIKLKYRAASTMPSYPHTPKGLNRPHAITWAACCFKGRWKNPPLHLPSKAPMVPLVAIHPAGPRATAAQRPNFGGGRAVQSAARWGRLPASVHFWYSVRCSTSAPPSLDAQVCPLCLSSGKTPINRSNRNTRPKKRSAPKEASNTLLGRRAIDINAGKEAMGEVACCCRGRGSRAATTKK